MSEPTASQQPTASPPVPPIGAEPWVDFAQSSARLLTTPRSKLIWAVLTAVATAGAAIVCTVIYSAVWAGTQINKIGDIDDGLKLVAADIKKTNDGVATTRVRVEGLAGEFVASEKAVSANLANVTSALEKQTGKVDNLELAVVAIAGKVERLEKRADSTDAKLDRLTDAVNQVAENVKKLTDPRAQVDPDQQLRQMMAMRLGAIEEKVGGIALWESCSVVLSRKNLLPNGEGPGLTFRVSPEEIEDDAKLTLILARVAKGVEGYLVRNADLSRQVPREVNSKVRYAEDGAILVSFTATDPDLKRVLASTGEAFLKSDDKPGPVTVVFPRRKD